MNSKDQTNEKYYIIRNEDGDTFVQELSKEQLLKNEYLRNTSVSNIPNIDTNYWNDKTLIIKGIIISNNELQENEKIETPSKPSDWLWI